MEWTIVTVLAALTGLLATVGAPVLKLNANIAKLTTLLDVLSDKMERLDKNNSESHQRLWQKNDRLDAALQDHEVRIHRLEDKKEERT